MFTLRRSRKSRLVGVVAASAALALALTACSSGGGGGGTSLGGGSNGGGSEDLIPFKVGAVPSIDGEPFFYAQEQGYYKDAGLDVTFSDNDSGPALVTGVINGTYDAGSTAAFPILIAIGKGSPLKIFPGVSDIVGPNYGNSGLVVKPDSPIKGYADLKGKTVATNALTSLTTLGLKIGLKDAGVDPDSVKVTSLPFKASVQAVAQGQADAAIVISPFFTIAENNGLKVIGDPIGDNLPEGSPYGVIFTSDETAKKKADAFKKFQEATFKAVKELKGDEALQRKLAETQVGLDPEVAKTVPLPGYQPSGIDVEKFQKYADDVAEFGYTDKPVDVSKVVVNP